MGNKLKKFRMFSKIIQISTAFVATAFAADWNYN